MKAAVQVLRRAEELKQKVTGDIVNDNDAWNNHQKLQDLYQQLLVIDLEYALDKKVEQDLWNYVFKNQINTLQMQAKDRKNPQRSESQESLIWFLEAASGFYLQFLQELCETFNLDIPCRRKGSLYGIAGEPNKPLATDIVPPHNSSCLYICQHCLVHLGDIARYRNQSLQAETFYRHAAELVPSNGQPYNQLAILEAAKGDKLSTVFYYVRSTAVKYPFPVAATNLQKMFSKIANDEFQHEGKTKLSVYDYVTAFLQFHALVHLTSDLDKAQKLGRVLAANLTILIATESLTAWKLIQMTAINMFSIAHSTRGLELLTSEKKEQSEPESLSEDEQAAYNLVLELIASTLNGMLLLVYTMKEDSDLKSYYVLPVIKLILEWLRQDPSHLKAASFTGKLQIWPSFCKLLNAIQSTQLSGFDINKYVDVPLPEDWDLQSFLPLYKAYRSYKFKEPSQHLNNEEEHTLRAVRLIALGHWLCEQEIYGVKLMMVQPSKEGKGYHFEAITPQTPSTDVLKQLEEMSLGRNSNATMTISITEPNGRQNESVAVNGKLVNGDHHSNGSTASSSGSPPSLADDTSENDLSAVKMRGNRGGGKPQHGLSETSGFGNKNSAGGKENQNRGGSGVGNSAGRERKTRQNVALQTIMQKKNMVIKNDIVDDHTSGIKLKSEGKQVTFKTPSPSPPASSSGTPPLPQQVTSSPSIFHTDMTSCFSPLRSPPYPVQQQQQQQKMKAFNGSHPHSDPNSNLIVEPMLGAVCNPTSQGRMMYSNLPNPDLNYPPLINPSATNKFGYFGNGEVHSLPSQSMSLQNNEGGNNVSAQQNSRLGVLGSTTTLNSRSTNGPGNIVPVPQAQPGFMFGFSQSQQSNVSQASSQMSQATPQNRLPINAAAVAAAVAAQKPPPPPPYMNPALFGQSSQPPQWFTQQQNAIGTVKSSNFDQIFSHLNRPQVPPPPPPPPSLHQGFPNSLMSNQPFGPSQRPQFPAPQDGNPYLYQMMRQMPDQLAFPSFPPNFMSQQPALPNNLQHAPPQSVSTNLGHVPGVSQSRLNNNLGISDIAMENHQQQNSYDGFPHLGAGGSLSRVHHDGHHGANMQRMPSIENSTSGGHLTGIGAVKSGPRAENGTGPLTSNENAPSTYSLFNSPWSSGLNLNNATSKDDEKPNSKMTGSKEMGGFFQPGLQSLWSVPGPSPLEWLLEQQKQKKDPAPH